RRSRAARSVGRRRAALSPRRRRCAAPLHPASARRRRAARRSLAQGNRARPRLPLGRLRAQARGGLSRGGGVKTALVHDWLTGLRGGERVLEQLCLLYPEADVFTLVHVPGSCGPIIEQRKIVASFLNRLPRRAYRHYLPLFPAAIESLDLRGYDL